MWKKILLKVLEGEKNILSPFHKEGIMKAVFVRINEKNRMGFLWIWCSKTYKGINISRLEIPENVDFLFEEDFVKLNLPKIEFMSWE